VLQNPSRALQLLAVTGSLCENKSHARGMGDHTVRLGLINRDP
jgi:hypothetical protein